MCVRAAEHSRQRARELESAACQELARKGARFHAVHEQCAARRAPEEFVEQLACARFVSRDPWAQVVRKGPAPAGRVSREAPAPLSRQSEIRSEEHTSELQ